MLPDIRGAYYVTLSVVIDKEDGGHAGAVVGTGLSSKDLEATPAAPPPIILRVVLVRWLVSRVWATRVFSVDCFVACCCMVVLFPVHLLTPVPSVATNAFHVLRPVPCPS